MLWTDDILVSGLKRREAGAIEHAVQLYAPKLYRYAYYQLGDPQAAEDLASEVMTRMLEKIDGYKYVGVPLQVWLFQIARNLVADAFRDRSKATLSLDAWLEGEEGARAPEGLEPGEIDSRLEMLGDREILRTVLSQLTDEQRQVIILRVIGGWQPSEIAQLLNRTIDSVKSLQYRAIQSMRRYLEREDTAVQMENG